MYRTQYLFKTAITIQIHYRNCSFRKLYFVRIRLQEDVSQNTFSLMGIVPSNVIIIISVLIQFTRIVGDQK